MPYNPPPAWATTPPMERAAHLFGSFYPERAEQFCIEEGIENEDRINGAELAAWRKTKRADMRAYYGDPAYGSWPESAGKELADAEREFLLTLGHARRDR